MSYGLGDDFRAGSGAKLADLESLSLAIAASGGGRQFPEPVHFRTELKKDGIRMLPVSEVAAKDEFFNIKNLTRDDLLAAHRVLSSTDERFPEQHWRLR